ncbi:hypothetical protein CcaverHIS002_0606850 [Cutaneotrichosporon cavernicola]|nr:hypothetical protein CcaverHIS002_0606850 [Cutaneotrichosporon cavernicola]
MSPVPVQNLKEWHTPSSRTEVIHELINGVARSRAASTTCLRTSRFLSSTSSTPQLSNPDVILNILIKALSATVHGPDFNVCLALLREPAAIVHDIDSDDESLIIAMPFLQGLHDLVRACQFTKFWAEFNGSSEAAQLLRSNPNYFPAHAGVLSKFRTEFASSIAASFSRVRLAQLARWLDIKPADVPAWCAEAGWSVDGELAVVPENGDNNVKAGVVKENVQLKQLTKLVAAAAF